MKIYTRTGDDGTTGLYSGRRLPKYHPRVEAYGTVDELNAGLGLLADHLPPGEELIHHELLRQQHHCFALGASLADDRPDQHYTLPPVATNDLEDAIDRMNALLPPLKHFILPGGAPAVSYAHLARTVCRRAERRVTELAAEVAVDASVVTYLNRLSDYLFVLGRYLGLRLGAEEVRWVG